MTCKFEIIGPHRLTCRAVRKLLQAFTRRHVPCAMCHQSTHGRHHRRSGVLARRMVPRRARSDQPFGRYSRKCLDTHTDWLTDWLTDRQTRPANYFSPTHQWKSSFIERSMLKHLNVHSLRFWIIMVPKQCPLLRSTFWYLISCAACFGSRDNSKYQRSRSRSLASNSVQRWVTRYPLISSFTVRFNHKGHQTMRNHNILRYHSQHLIQSSKVKVTEPKTAKNVIFDVRHPLISSFTVRFTPKGHQNMCNHNILRHHSQHLTQRSKVKVTEPSVE